MSLFLETIVTCFSKILPETKTEISSAGDEDDRFRCNCKLKLDGCTVWNAHNTVLGEVPLLIYIVPVCYVKHVGMERPSNIIISLHRKKNSIITNIPSITS